MHPQRAQQLVELVVVGEHCSAVAIAAQGFRWEKGGGCRISKAARSSFPDAAAKALCAVLQQQQAMLFTDSFNPLIVCRLSKQVHRYYSARTQLALLFDNSNRFFQLIRVKIEGALVHIHKDRGSAFKGNDLRAGQRR